MTSLTYQNIVNLIRATALAINPSGTFVHARRSDGSLEYDGAMPQIHLYPFQVKGSENKDADLIIGFWKQDSPESSNEEREAIISDMDILSRQFFETLDATQTIEILNWIAEPNYRQLSGTLSGYIARFTLRGALSCEDIPVPITCPTLCEQIADSTAQIIVNCMSAEQETDMEGLICSPVGNATAVLKNTEGTVQSTTSIPCGDTEDITAPNAVAQLTTQGGAPISSTNIPSGKTLAIAAPDATVRNSDNTYNESVASGATLNLADTTYKIFIGGNLTQSFTQPSMINLDVNIYP